MPTTDNTASETVTSRLRDAFQATLAEMGKLTDDELVHITVDVGAAVATALGAWPEIKGARALIAAKLPDFDLTSFDKLETYARAAGHAQVRYNVARGPSASLAELGERGLKLRELLWSSATVLAQSGLLDGSRVKELRSSTGYRNVAFDLFGLVEVLRQTWDTIVGKTAIDTKQLDEAEQLAEQLLTEVGMREQAPVAIADASHDRQRAFTLFVRTYDEARRAISYLRWSESDVDEIAPSLYAGRGGRRRAADAGTDLPRAPVTTPTAPVAQAVASPTAPAMTAPQASGVGLPSSEPFTR